MLEKTISAARSASDAKLWIIKDTAHPWKKKRTPRQTTDFHHFMFISLLHYLRACSLI